MKSALSAKAAEKSIFVVDALNFEKPSTKQAAAMLKDLGLEGKKVTVVLSNEDTNAFLSLRNIPRVRPIFAFETNTYDLVDNTAVLMTKDAVTYLGEVLS
jgi:large subunit ribosomal protein L4